MATEERVVLTAELRDEASAPLRQVNRIIDSTTRDIERAHQRQGRAASSSGRETAAAAVAAGGAVSRMQSLISRGTSVAGAAYTNLQRTVTGGTGRISTATNAATTAVTTMFNRTRQGSRDFVSGFRDSNAAISSFSGAMGTLGGVASIGAGAGRSIAAGLESAAGSAARLGSRVGSEVAAGARTAVTAIGTIGAAITGIAVAGGLKRMLNIENAQAKLTGLGVSAQEVTEIMENASAAVSGTAFGLDQAATVAAGAMAAGIAPGQEMTDYLTLIADAATIAGTDLGEMGSIMGKVTNTGKVTTEVLDMFGERGVGALNMLAESFGVPVSAMQDMVTAGEISAADFQRVLTENLGGAAQASGDTTAGAFANMRAAMSRTGEALLEGFFPAFKLVFGTVQSIFNTITGLVGPVAAAIAEKFMGVAAPGIEGFGAAAEEWLNKVAVGLQALWDLVVGHDFTGEFRKVFGVEEDSKIVDTLLNINEGFAGLAPVMAPIAAGILAFSSGLLRGLPIIGQYIPMMNPLLVIFAALVASSPELQSALMNVFTSLAPVIMQVVDVLSSLMPVVAAVLTKVVEFAAVLIDKMAPILPVLLPAILGIVAAMKAWRAITATVAAVKIGLAAASATGTAAMIAEATATKAGAAAYKVKAAAMKVAAGAQKLLTLAMKANPIGLIITGIVALVAGLVWFFTQTETGRAIVQSAWEGIKSAMAAVVDWWNSTLIPGLRSIGDWFASVWNGAKDVMASVVSWWNGTLIPALQAVGQWFVSVWEGAKNAVGTAVDWIQEKAGQIAAWFSSTFGPAISVIGDIFTAVWGWISLQVQNASLIIQAVLFLLVEYWNSTLLPALQVVGDFFKMIWDGILIAVQWVITQVQTFIGLLVEFWNAVLLPALQWLGEFFKMIWDGILLAVQWVVTQVQLFIGLLVEFWNAVLLPALQWLGEFFTSIWNGILAIVQFVITLIQAYIGVLVAFWNGVLLPALQWVGNLFSSIWNGILGIVASVVGGVQGAIAGMVGFWNGTLSPAISAVASWFSGKLSSAIGGVTGFIDNVRNGFQNFINFISSSVQPIIDTIAGAFGRLGDKVGSVMGSLRDFAANPLGGLADWAGSVLPGNSGGGVYSGGGVVDAPAQFAGGGVLRGYAPGKDTIPAVLSKGEAVLVPELVRAIGPRNIMALNHQYSGGRPAGSGPARASKAPDLSSLMNALMGGSERVHAAGGAVVDGASAGPRYMQAAPAAGGTATLVRVEEGAVKIEVNTGGAPVSPADLEAIKEAVEEVFEEAKRRSY